MNRRIEKKVERSMMASKICELQQKIDEYNRFLDDLTIMIAKKNPDMWCVAHGVDGDNYMGWLWDECVKLLKENDRMAQELQGKSEKSK